MSFFNRDNKTSQEPNDEQALLKILSDAPAGSPESRAAARALADAKRVRRVWPCGCEYHNHEGLICMVRGRGCADWHGEMRGGEYRYVYECPDADAAPQ